MLSLHFFFELPCKYTLGSDGLYLLAHSAFIEKVSKLEPLRLCRPRLH
jgi:hypothetical protein